jgi:hypothetical protein
MLARVVALAVAAGGGLYLALALALPFGTPARPGAAFFPVVVALFTCVVGLVATTQAFLTAPAASTPREVAPDAAERRGRVVSAIVVLVAFCVLLPWLGYLAAAFGFVVVLLRRLGSGWRAAVVAAILSAAVSHYLFAVLLDVPLPPGPW